MFKFSSFLDLNTFVLTQVI